MPKVLFLPRVQPVFPLSRAHGKTPKYPGLLLALHGLDSLCVIKHRVPPGGILIPQWYELCCFFFDVSEERACDSL